ncbi:hypothetical protein Tco_1297459, partial [Tanacetum coccineum]
RVESFDNEESLGEDASKQERIDAINADEEITLVSVQNVDEEMFDVNVLDVEVINTAKLITDAAQVSVAGNVVSTVGDATTVSVATTNTATITIVDDITLAQALMEIKTKRAEEKRNKPPTKAQQKKIMCTYLKNMERYKLNDLKLKDFDFIQEMFDRALKRVNTFEDFRTELVEGKEKRAGTKLIQENTKNQKVEDDKEIAELKQLMKIIPDEEEVAIDAIHLAVKSPSIVGWKIYKEGIKSYYQIVRADRKSQMYMFFSQMLKSFDRGDLEDLYKVVKAK